MKHPTRLIATLAAAVAALALGAAPALADSQAHRDPRGDVENVSSSKAAPQPGIDLVHSANSYRGNSLDLDVEASNLLKKGYGVVWIISTPTDTYQLTYDHLGAQPTTSFQDIGRRSWSLARALHRGTPLACTGYKAKAVGDAVRATVPRTCLAGADEVRIAALIIEPRPSGSKVDDPRRKGYDPMQGPKLAPTLERN